MYPPWFGFTGLALPFSSWLLRWIVAYIAPAIAILTAYISYKSAESERHRHTRIIITIVHAHSYSTWPPLMCSVLATLLCTPLVQDYDLRICDSSDVHPPPIGPVLLSFFGACLRRKLFHMEGPACTASTGQIELQQIRQRGRWKKMNKPCSTFLAPESSLYRKTSTECQRTGTMETTTCSVDALVCLICMLTLYPRHISAGVLTP